MRRTGRRVAIGLVLLVSLLVFWIVGGRQLSLLFDRFRTIEAVSAPITSISYQGNGSGGILHVNELMLGLDEALPPARSPNFGTSKDGQLALSTNGQVFAFGPLRSGGDQLVADRPAGDDASITSRHSILSWPTLLDLNFMTGQSPMWRRYRYYKLDWTKPSRARLEMVWRYEEYFYSGNGWTGGQGTRQGVTGLISVDISNGR